jgi:HEPN domain-containing protein
LRLDEAEALYGAGCYDGCAYLCGYVVELALKAAICATLQVAEFPEKGSRLRESFKTHDFDDLKLLASMEQAFTTNATLLANWSVASKWRPERRYDIKGTYDQVAAKGILDAVRDYPDGVLACISLRW